MDRENAMDQGMERVNRIWRHPEYQACLEEIRLCEEGRRFCRHTPEHFLDVARLACLLAFEQGVRADREQIYAAGLLHDIGRHLQYREGIPHEQASAKIAKTILVECGFDEGEQEKILEMIRSHRTKPRQAEEREAEQKTAEKKAEKPEKAGGAADLAELFYRADKLSRNCFLCPVQGECDWPREKKNLEIQY